MKPYLGGAAAYAEMLIRLKRRLDARLAAREFLFGAPLLFRPAKQSDDLADPTWYPDKPYGIP